jgi:formate/nitrite transporter FocA (FNT family)
MAIETANAKQNCQEKVANKNNKPATKPVEKSVICNVDITAKVYVFLKFKGILVKFSVFSHSNQ